MTLFVFNHWFSESPLSAVANHFELRCQKKQKSVLLFTRDSAEIFRFRGIIWSMSKKDFPIQLLRPGLKSQ